MYMYMDTYMYISIYYKNLQVSVACTRNRAKYRRAFPLGLTPWESPRAAMKTLGTWAQMRQSYLKAVLP